MDNKRYWIVALTFIYLNLGAQNKSIEKINVYSEFGIIQSFLSYNLSNVERRNSIEFRLGGIIEKSLSKHFGIRSGLRIGIKPKTNYSLNSFSILTYSIDETYNLRNHFYLEVPLNITYRYKKFQIGSGVLARHYFSNHTSGDRDFLKGHSEFGINSNLNFSITKKMKLGIDTYFGLTDIWSTYFGNSVQGYPPGTDFRVRNNFFGLSAYYKIK